MLLVLRFYNIVIFLYHSKSCSFDIVVCLIKSTILDISNNLFCSVPYMLYCFAVNSFTYTKHISIVGVTCCCFAISKAIN